MAGESKFPAVKDEIGGSMVSDLVVASFKTAVQNAEQALVSREAKFKKEMEEQRRENELLNEKLQLQVLEKLRLERECKGLKEMVSRVTEERDGMKNKLREKEADEKKISELKRKNCDLECDKLRAVTDLDVYKRRFMGLEVRVSCLEKDLEMLNNPVEIDVNLTATAAPPENFSKSEVLSEKDANPSDGSSNGNRTEDRIIILDSDDE